MISLFKNMIRKHKRLGCRVGLKPYYLSVKLLNNNFNYMTNLYTTQ